MFEYVFRCGTRYGSRILLAIAAAILVLGCSLSVVRFMQVTTEIVGGGISYNEPFAAWLLLLGGLLSAVKEAAVPFVAAIVLERVDRWFTKPQIPGTSN